MPARSPTVALSETGAVDLSDGTDSPVSAASSVRRFLTSVEADVGGDLVAEFEEHDVAWHERLRRDHRRLPVAQGSRFRREHVADRIERLLRPAFLKEAEQSVDDDDAEDDRGVEPQVHHQLDEAGGEQHIDKHIVELLQEAHERTALARGRQHVEAVFRLAARGFGLVEARGHAGLEPLDGLIGGQRVPGRLFCFGFIALSPCAPRRRARDARPRARRDARAGS